MIALDLPTLLPWSKPRRLATPQGEAWLRTAPLKEGHAFFEVWRTREAELRAAGVRVGQWPKNSGRWQATWWAPIDEATKAAEAQAREASRATDAEIEIPAPAGLKYLPFQKAGVAGILKRFALPGVGNGVLLGDEPGTGKTIISCGVVNACPEIQRILVICPATLKWNWFKEMTKWLVPKRSIGVATGQCFPTTDIVIINYDVLHRWPKRLAYYWDLVICDEAHAMCNPKSRRSRCVYGYRPRRSEDASKARSGIPTRRKLALTGTPIVNRPAELFPLIHWLDPLTWDNAWRFMARYANAHQTRFGWDCSGASNLGELQDKLRSSGLMIRRLKKDVLPDLPAKFRRIVEIRREDMDSATRAAVDEELSLWQQNEAQTAASYQAVEMAKASTQPQDYARAVASLRECLKVKFTEMARERQRVAMATIPHAIAYLEELAEDDPGAKVIVFAHHKAVIAQLRERFPKSAVVDGSVEPERRMREVDRFQTDPECKHFFGSIRAAAEGITLTASSHVIFVEEDWTPGKTTQCEDRAARIGQLDNVLVEHLVLAGSLSARMVRVNLAKQEIMDELLDTDPRKAQLATEIVAPEGFAERPRERRQESLALA